MKASKVCYAMLIIIAGCSSEQAELECTKVDTQMATVLLDCSTEPKAVKECINLTITSLTRAQAFKKVTLIRFSDSQDDLDVRDFLLTLYPSEGKSTINLMTLNRLDVAFKKDRELGNVYIYKILDLMDRNYDINNFSDDVADQLKAEAIRICQNN